MDIRAELKKLMELKGYSTGHVALSVGAAKSTISMWLNDKYKGDSYWLWFSFDINRTDNKW